MKKSDALSRINHWDVKEKDNLLTLEETEERNLAREDYKYWSLMEEVFWRQSPENLANSHRRRNFIKKIKINGIWFEEEATIRREVAGAYKDFLSDPGG